MFRLYAIIILIFNFLFVIPAFAEQDKSKQIKLGQSFELDKNSIGTIFEFHEVTMKFEAVKIAGEDWIESVSLSIKRENEAPLKIISQVSPSMVVANLGLYSFEDAGAPVIMFQTYYGGAHCCSEVTMINLGNEVIKAEKLGIFDGGFLEPEDGDGDGIFEIITYDNRFLYSFDSYAFSYSPSIIFSSKKDDNFNSSFYNASFEARFDKVFEAEYEQMQEACLYGEYGITMGACSGWLAVAARLGKYKEVKEQVVKAIKQQGYIDSIWKEYSFCLSDDCKEKATFTSFPTAVEFALIQWGYLRK